jgi:endo-1,4-beta-xylanase
MLCMIFTLLMTPLLRAALPNEFVVDAPQVKLYPGDAPGSEGATAPEEWMPPNDGFHRVKNIHNPSMYVFLPPKERTTGAAFIICCGGGHQYLSIELEGFDVSKRLNEMGIASFVLKSRLSRTEGFNYKVDVESLADAQRAIRTVRSRAAEWNVDPKRVGIMGFSAGGELAALASTRSTDGKPDAADPVEQQSSRPDFAVIGYPGGKLGALEIPKTSPPTFIVVAADDNLSINAAEYYIALKKAAIPTELHIYDHGGHGFGMRGRVPEFKDNPAAKWPERLREWMVDREILPGKVKPTPP